MNDQLRERAERLAAWTDDWTIGRYEKPHYKNQTALKADIRALLAALEATRQERDEVIGELCDVAHKSPGIFGDMMRQRDAERARVRQLTDALWDADAFLADPSGNPLDAINLSRSRIREALASEPAAASEDEEIVRIVRERNAADTGERLTVEELAESVGVDLPASEEEPA